MRGPDRLIIFLSLYLAFLLGFLFFTGFSGSGAGAGFSGHPNPSSLQARDFNKSQSFLNGSAT